MEPVMQYLNSRKHIIFPLMLVASLLAAPLPASAQETKGFQPRAGIMADQLNPALQKFDPDTKTGPRMKDIVVTGKGQQQYGVVADMWRKLILSLHFAPGSDRLPPKARKLLEDVGSALEELNGSNRKFLVVGHTDSTGDTASNQRLSTRRAHAVRDYILGHFNIEPGRLLVAGLGETEPLDPENPASVQNRRVEIILVDRVVDKQDGSAPYRTAPYKDMAKAGKKSSNAVCNSYRGPELKDIRPKHLGMDDYDARTPVPCAAATGYIEKK